MKRPLALVGFAIMIMAVFAGFVPSFWSILMVFATTLLGGHYIKKTAPEDYKNFLRMFGGMVTVFNIVAVGMIMMTPLDYIDKASAAFLNLMVIMVIVTLLYNTRNEK